MFDFLTEQKTKFFFAGAIIATVWAYGITTQSQSLASQPVWIQFILSTLIVYAIPSFIVGAYFDGDYRKTLGILLLASSMDLLAPPLNVNLEGSIITTTLGAGGAIDVFLGTIWQGIGISGFLLFFFVYPISFIILLGSAIYLLTEKEFISASEYI